MPPKRPRKPAARKRQSSREAAGKRQSAKPSALEPAPGDEAAGEPVPGDDATGRRFPIVGVGASAGGLEAFTQLLQHLPLDTGMGFVLVQHLDPEHESALTQILARATRLPVLEITDGQPARPDQVHVIPRDRTLLIEDGRLKLTPRGKARAPHRPIDSFFESLSQDARDRAIGVVLSGTASDGTLGLEAIKAEGGITFAQDDSARYGSMPQSAIAAGCVDLVLSPADIAGELARIARHPYAAGRPLSPEPGDSGAADDGAADERAKDDRREDRRGEENRAAATAHQDDGSPLPSGGRPAAKPGPGRARGARRRPGADGGYKKILLLLHDHSGVDFSLYKSTTIQRRVGRRIVLTKHDTLDDYADFLRGNPKELDALYSDVLISVTSFFRNPEMFDALSREILPRLFEERTHEPVRCWVLGCSTGQEAYSIAMAFAEAVDSARHRRPLQIFATDLNEALLDKARHGLYAKSLVDEIAPERLRRFFVEERGGYRVTKKLRQMVVFARQNIIVDPPFSRMDIVSCRNVLIYLDPALQKRALPTFHYALRPGGFLLLGASESIGEFTELFEPVDRKHKIFLKRPGPTPTPHLPLARRDGAEAWTAPPLPPLPRPDPPAALRGELDAQREADRITLARFASPGVLVSGNLQVLQFRGPTGRYLEPPPGKATFDLLKMAKEGLMLPLRAALQQARKEQKTVRRERVRIKRSGQNRQVNLEIIPLKNLREPAYLVLFEEAGRAGRRAPAPGASRSPRPGTKQEKSRIAELETSLSETRDYIQSMHEQHEAVSEELQSANEEVQSANEELQSLNEELETSKEELESANEELVTVNDEMNGRNIELARLNDDLVNLEISTRLAVLLLGRDLCLRRFSVEAEKQLGLVVTDLGRPIDHIRHSLVRAAFPAKPQAGEAPPAPVDLGAIAAEVIASLRDEEHEVWDDRASRWYSMRVRPYLTVDGKVDGTVVVLVDIDRQKQSEALVATARDYAENILATVRQPLLVLDDTLRVTSANAAFYRSFRVTSEGTIGRSMPELGNRQWDIPRLRQRLEEILPRSTTIEEFEVERDFPAIGPKIMLLDARRMTDPERKGDRILLAIEDVTLRRHAEEATARLAAIVTSSQDAIISEDAEGVIVSWNQAAEHIFGYAAQEVIGKPVTLLIPENDLDEQPNLLERVRRGDVSEHYEAVRRRRDGSLIDLSLTVSPIRDSVGRIIGASQIARDITERKRVEEALAAGHALVQTHVEELSRFNRAAVGRELRMIELKKEMNALCARFGEAARFPLEFEDDRQGGDGRLPPSRGEEP